MSSSHAGFPMRRADEDDDLRAFADRDEEPREATGYQRATTRPKTDAGDRLLFCDGGGEDCPGYRHGVVMHQRPGGGGPRVWCSACVGRANLRTVDSTRDAIRGLKSAMAMGHAQDEREAFMRLSGLVGKQQADDTATAIRRSFDAKPERGRRSER